MKRLLGAGMREAGYVTRRVRASLSGSGVWSRRSFANYQEYVDLQLAKTLDEERRRKWLSSEWEPKVDAFQRLFGDLAEQGLLPSRGPALCIGARTGQEVQALRNLGLEAIGVDLAPSPPLVVEGDLHALPFPDGEFTFVFSNVMDHALFPRKAVEEIERVAAGGATVVLHLTVGRGTDSFGVTEIAHASDVVELFEWSTSLMSKALSPPFLSMNHEIVMTRS